MEVQHEQIAFSRINNDNKGNPRYVCFWLNLFSAREKDAELNVSYANALIRAKKVGGKKYHNKQYGGGIVFRSYNIRQLSENLTQLVAIESNPSFIKEWNRNQFNAINRAITWHFGNQLIQTQSGPVHLMRQLAHIQNVLGLAYTSSSSYAMYSICNVQAKYRKDWNYDHFAIAENGRFYAIVRKENDEIGNTDIAIEL